MTLLETERRPGAAADVVGFATDWEVARNRGTVPSPLRSPVYLVVGFDGTEPARRALDSAARLLHDQEGVLEVVYVAHLPATAALSPRRHGRSDQRLRRHGTGPGRRSS